MVDAVLIWICLFIGITGKLYVCVRALVCVCVGGGGVRARAFVCVCVRVCASSTRNSPQN